MDAWGWFIVGMLAGAALGAYEAVRQCASATLHGKRRWWVLAIHSAEHRVSHRKFKHDLESGRGWDADELERSVKDKR